MNGRVVKTVVFLLVGIGFLVGAVLYFSKNLEKTASLQEQGSIREVVQKQQREPEKATKSAVQTELEELSKNMLADLESEKRLNLNMVGQLRAFDQMLTSMQSYAAKVQKQIKIIEEISKTEFQEDVQLQASLFAGKKPELVAKHLEEFRASRVGAILAKMKEKEAGRVLDVWAKSEDSRASAFYREAMAAYLSNKRRDMHPDLFPVANSNDSDSSTSPN